MATRLPVLTRIGADNRRDLIELHRGLRHEIGCLKADAYSVEVATVNVLLELRVTASLSLFPKLLAHLWSKPRHTLDDRLEEAGTAQTLVGIELEE